MIGNWKAFPGSAVPEEEFRGLRRHARTGRLLGDETFLGRLEEMVGRVLKPQKRGPNPNAKGIKLCVPRISPRISHEFDGSGLEYLVGYVDETGIHREPRRQLPY